MSSDLHELVAPYALDALDADERARFERHLAECERCSSQLMGLQEAAGALAYAVEGPEPPASLRSRILEEARRDDLGKVVPFPRRSWALPAVAAVAAAAACLAVGLGIWATSLSRSLDRERSAKAGYAQAFKPSARARRSRVSRAPMAGCSSPPAGAGPRRLVRALSGSVRQDVRGLGDRGKHTAAGRALSRRRRLPARRSGPRRPCRRDRRRHARAQRGCPEADPADPRPLGGGLTCPRPPRTSMPAPCRWHGSARSREDARS